MRTCLAGGVHDVVEEKLHTLQLVEKEQIRLRELKVVGKVEFFDKVQADNVQARKNPAAATAALRCRLALLLQTVGVFVSVTRGDGRISQNIDDVVTAEHVAGEFVAPLLQYILAIVVNCRNINDVGGRLRIGGRHDSSSEGEGSTMQIRRKALALRTTRVAIAFDSAKHVF